MQTPDDKDAKISQPPSPPPPPPVSQEERQQLADKIEQLGLNELTVGRAVGKEGEPSVEYTVGQFHIAQRPEDKFALRVSLGELHIAHERRIFYQPSCYFVFRGDPRKIERLLERALDALRASRFWHIGSQL